MFKTIFSRLFWTTTAVVLFTVAVVSLSMMGLLSKYVEDEHFYSAQKASGSIEYLTNSISRDGFDARSMMMYNSTLESWSMLVNAEITVVNKNQRVFAATNDQLVVPEKFGQRVMAGETVSAKMATLERGGKMSHIIGVPIRQGNTVIGGIFYFFPPGVGATTVGKFSSTIFLTLIIAVLLSLLLIYAEARHISRPLKEINNAVLEIASGKFDKRVNVTARGEVAQLASSYNYMADSLERLEEMRSSFVSDISHELRTPMTSISGFVQGILDGTIPKEKEKEYLEIVLDESTRLAKLTSEMFEMTKMNSPEYKLSIQKFNVNEEIRRCIISAEQKLEAKNLELSVDFENETENVLADPDAIKRVIINLLDNAIKFSHPENTIEIKVRGAGKKVLIDFVNYGTGIEKEDLPHIFDRFYKSDKSRTRDKQGAGLGLSFVKNILNLHAQNITVTSDPYEDKMKTVFSFTLEKA
ncbi:MAG: HAMP domain-containing histidine kinase [Clostridia bacterium]|nr:HAMP domain-containing histidine kinase [Clostridia bacterium]